MVQRILEFGPIRVFRTVGIKFHFAKSPAGFVAVMGLGFSSVRKMESAALFQ
jgi:hypothetical protein